MKPRKLLQRLQTSQTNVRFADLERLARAMGFALVRQSGSHRIYQHAGHADARLNLQDVGGQAKPYQVRQFLALVEEYNLTLAEAPDDPE